ncbi:MAG: 30S ribosome-binding factor RbfA [Actinomycetota bacterium]|nr:30S ribosome-binding factor RbfA [Actinomycetota bacterium]
MSDRMAKVNSTLREVLAEEIERMNDSRFEMVSITGVDTAPNLRRAMVYVDVLGTQDQTDAVEALNGAAKRLQASIARQVRLKYTPILEFEMDPGIVGGEKIDALLRSLSDEEDGEDE